MSDWECPYCHDTGYIVRRGPEGHPDIGKVYECRCLAEKRKRAAVQRLREMSGITDVELEQWRFETFDPQRVQPLKGKSAGPAVRFMEKAVALVREWAADPQGWLVLQGEVGCGKSHLAFAVANYRIQQNQPVYVAAVPDMLDVLRAAYNAVREDEFERRFTVLKETPLLILDDLGSEKGSEWAVERLFILLNYRYQKRLPLLVTTNDSLGPDSRLDRRILSRLGDGAMAKNGFSRILRLPVGDFRPYNELEMPT